MERGRGAESDITNRINKARGSFLKLREVWSARKIKLATKMKLFNAVVKSAVLYSSECWAMTKTLEKRLQVFQQKCLRRILKIFWPNGLTNEEVLQRTGQKDIAIEVKERRLRWFGHVLRREDDHLSREAVFWRAGGRRRRG